MNWQLESSRCGAVRAFIGLVLVILVGGCASTLAPHNDRLGQGDFAGGYRFTNARPKADAESLIAVSFSGGGTRAATLAYGVMRELAKTTVTSHGEQERLLDLVETISAVSGGSYTAAYYGLFGDRLFEDFESRFLKRDIQSQMLGSLLNPINIVRLTSPFFGRSDVAAETIAEHLFEHKSFRDMLLAQREFNRPFIQINATDMGRVSRFEFSQEQFDLLCSDLSSYSVARAVIASSAVPVVFTPITLKNYAGQCGYTEPPWLETAAASREASLRRYYIAGNIRSYLDAEKRPYVHLIDGGLADNLGLRASLDRLLLVGAGELAEAYELLQTRRFVQIVVNAQARLEFPDFDQRAEVPSLGAIAFALSNTTDRYSIETLALLRTSMGTAVDALKAARRAAGMPDPDDVTGYLIEINFDSLQDPAERAYFNELPTSFQLPAEAVDRLIEVAGRLLRSSPDFQRLLRDMAGDTRAARAGAPKVRTSHESSGAKP